MHRTRLVAALGAVGFVTSIDSAGAATYAVGHPSEPPRSGTYSKTLSFTLSTTRP
jgi:hypothetical protein